MRGSKRLTLFAAYNIERPEAFLTFTLKKNDAFNYVKRLLVFENFQHFQRWCDLNDHDITKEKTIDEYYDVCVPDSKKEQFAIAKISYSMNDVVAIMRMFGQCTPLGCEFETPMEEAYFQEVIEKHLSQYFEDIEDNVDEQGESI